MSQSLDSRATGDSKLYNLPNSRQREGSEGWGDSRILTIKQTQGWEVQGTLHSFLLLYSVKQCLLNPKDIPYNFQALTFKQLF